ncbi:hypothetical protein F4679DRAFT_583998 [Xylaria curta]|nr:hypothetical protein F4679DRAFT_583998 [Xylaria curta]
MLQTLNDNKLLKGDEIQDISRFNSFIIINNNSDANETINNLRKTFQSHHHITPQPVEMTQSKEQKIEEVRTKLPLPEQPPVASDWQSADARTVNVGAGGVSSDISTGAGSTSGLREPASKGADVDLSSVGRQGKDNLEGLPKDAKA